MAHETLENHMVNYSQHDYKATDHTVEANHKHEQIIAYMLANELTEYETDYARIEYKEMEPITGTGHNKETFMIEFPEADAERYWEIVATVPCICHPRPCNIVLGRLAEDGFEGEDLARAKELLDVHEGRMSWKVWPKIPDPLPPGWPDLDPEE